MSDRFLKFFGHLVPDEGTYSDDPDDSGGRTIFGISEASFPNQFLVCYNLYQTQGKEKSLAYAQQFYAANFYKPIYDQIHDERVAFKVYDLGINEGCVTAIKLLQEAIGCDSDGIFGQNTLSMVNSKDCYQDYLNEAEKHYRDIVGKNPKDKKFLNGWLNRLHRSI